MVPATDSAEGWNNKTKRWNKSLRVGNAFVHQLLTLGPQNTKCTNANKSLVATAPTTKQTPTQAAGRTYAPTKNKGKDNNER